MLRSLYTAATGMEAQEIKMDVIAHNLANTTTTGFKKSRAEFEDLLSETIRGATRPFARGRRRAQRAAGGPGRADRQHHPQPGPGRHDQHREPARRGHRGARASSRSSAPNGEPAYTRAGNFRVDATGRLVTQQGELIEPGITVPPEATGLTIRPDGQVLARIPGRDEPSSSWAPSS